MRKLISTFVPVLGLALLISGCVGPEGKLGRGLSNMSEPIRLGEMRRSIEHATVLGTPNPGFAAGFFHGVNRTLARTGAGVYEVVTFPIPNHSPKDYGPIFKPTNPVYPDSYHPNWLSDEILATDTALGFSGGDIIPIVPGSRFHVFDN